MKVQICVVCSFCEGEAYLPVRETISCTGGHYTQHRRLRILPWLGEQEKWVSQREYSCTFTQHGKAKSAPGKYSSKTIIA